MLISTSLPPHLPLLVAYLTGLHHVLAMEGLDLALWQSLTAGLEILYRLLCQCVQDMLNHTPSDALSPTPCDSLHAFFHNTSIWEEMAACVTLAELELPQVNSSAAVSFPLHLLF